MCCNIVFHPEVHLWKSLCVCFLILAEVPASMVPLTCERGRDVTRRKVMSVYPVTVGDDIFKSSQSSNLCVVRPPKQRNNIKEQPTVNNFVDLISL